MCLLDQANRIVYMNMNAWLVMVTIGQIWNTPAIAQTPGVNDVASVAGKVVTVQEFRASVQRLGDDKTDMVSTNPVLRRQYLDHMINGQLLAKEAMAQGVDKTPEFLQKLEDKRSDLLAVMFVDQYFKKEMTPKSLKKYFDQNQARFSKKEIRASHIIVDSEKRAAELIAEAKKPGANFDDMVKKYGTPLDGALSGDLGYFSRGRMMPEFEEAAFATKKGDVHPKPVKTSFGWHVLKVMDIRGDDRVEYDKVKSEVERQMKTDLQHDLLLKLRKRENVIINEEVLKATKF